MQKVNTATDFSDQKLHLKDFRAQKKMLTNLQLPCTIVPLVIKWSGMSPLRIVVATDSEAAPFTSTHVIINSLDG